MHPAQSQVPNPEPSRITPSNPWLPASRYLFLFLLAIYLFTYTPRINSSDGLAMFATAESLVRRGALDIEQIRWMGLQQGTYGLDGLLYSRKGIGVPIGLLPLTWLGLVVPWFGTVSASLLFNAIVTAATAVLLLGYLQQLGFSQRIGLIVALTYGLTTLAWPYAKSLFSDPFSGLLLLAAAFMLLKFRHGITSRGAEEQGSKGAKTISPAPLLPCPPASWRSLVKSLRYPFLAGLFLGWNVATRYAETLFLPVYGLLLLTYLFTIHYSQFTIHNLKKFIIHLHAKRPSFIIQSIIAFSAPILLISLGLITFNLSRYGDPFNTGYLPNETFSGVLWEGIVGQLISPGRGLLLYCPIFIVSLWGVVLFFRRFQAEAMLALSVIIIHLLLYGKWFMWHGGYAWGPRFMIPTLPFWAMFLAPIVERVFPVGNWKLGIEDWKPKILRITFLALAILSLISQLLSVMIDFAPFQNSLLDTGLPLFARQTFFNPQYSAIVGAWAFISLDTLDLAWVWQGQVNWWLLAALVVNIGITGFYLKWQIESNKKSKIQYLPYLSTLIALIFLLTRTHTLPPQSLQDTAAALNKTIQPTDAVITNNTEIAMPLAELYKGHTLVLGLNNGGFPLPDDVTSRLKDTIAKHSQVWWLPNWLPPEESAIEQTLLAEGFQARSDNFNGQRLVLFAYPPNLPADTTFVKANFDNLISLTEVAYPPNTAEGVAFPVQLQWQAITPLVQNYHVFIHLLDREGQVVAQADGQPAQWKHPTSTWVVGETVVDRHGLWIPAKTAPGEYQLLMGVYRPEDGRRLSLLTGEDTVRFVVWIE